MKSSWFLLSAGYGRLRDAPKFNLSNTQSFSEAGCFCQQLADRLQVAVIAC